MRKSAEFAFAVFTVYTYIYKECELNAPTFHTAKLQTFANYKTMRGLIF